MKTKSSALFLIFLFITLLVSFGAEKSVRAATFTVNSTADGIDAQGCDTTNCTLREAIEAANVDTTVDDIVFNIGLGTPTINVGSGPPPSGPTPLNEIENPVRINGNTGGATRVELNGASITIGADRSGLRISSGGITVNGLVINRFRDAGIRLETGGGNTITNCLIGTTATGVSVGAGDNNLEGGIRIEGSPNNVIGGSTVPQRNFISGNGGPGIFIGGTGATGNTIQGNVIGVSSLSTALPNGFDGIEISSIPGNGGNIIGGTTLGTRNVISGNGSNGILIQQSDGNTIQGNFIGTHPDGNAAIANGQDGVRLIDADSNVIGGTTGTTPGGNCTGACNLISGNQQDGIDMDTSTGNQILGNYIGTDFKGGFSVRNSDTGVSISLSPANTIGGTTPAARNLISGNLFNGIALTAASSGNLVQGNFIGVDRTGAVALPNGTVAGGQGIIINGAPSNLIGGSPAAGNTIAFNIGDGVEVFGAAGNAILSNSIFQNAVGGIVLAGSPVGNNNQPAPVLSSAASNNCATQTTGTLNSLANTDFTLEFFSNLPPIPAEIVQGRTFLGSAQVTTNNLGIANFTIDLLTPTDPALLITATATSPTNDTSRFSNAIAITGTATNPGTLQFSAPTFTAGEGANTATITATRTGGSDCPVAVNFSTSDGTATAGADYTAASGTLNWNDGDTTNKTFNITLLEDTIDEPDETVNLALSNPTGGANLGTPITAALTITDNDAPPTGNGGGGGGCGMINTSPSFSAFAVLLPWILVVGIWRVGKKSLR